MKDIFSRRDRIFSALRPLGPCRRGCDTFGPFRLVGGTAKGHPDARDPEHARRFYRGILAGGRGTQT